jgi:hypothetical protein
MANCVVWSNLFAAVAHCSQGVRLGRRSSTAWMQRSGVQEVEQRICTGSTVVEQRKEQLSMEQLPRSLVKHAG